MKWTCAVSFLSILLISGCEKSVPRTDYFPLRDGNRWEYRLLDRPLLKRLNAGQTILTAPLNAEPSAENDAQFEPKAAVLEAPPEQDTPSQKTDGAQKPVTARRVALELRAAVDPLTYRAIYDTAEQVWSKRSGYIGFQSARGRSYLLILPPHTGTRWVVTGPGGQDLYYEIEAAAGKAATPAGTFQNCALARQESRDRREIFRYWFAPNVGLVRRSKYFVGEEVFRQELVEYQVQPATPATLLAEEHEVQKAIEGKRRGNEFRDTPRDQRAGRLDALKEDDPQREKVEKYEQPR